MVHRIEASVEDPLSLEQAGFALFDMYPTRRGNLFSDEVYRLTRAHDATTVYVVSNSSANTTADRSLPLNHKISTNDVVMVTRQPHGSGDLFDASALPISETAQKLEARVLGVGPTYVDVCVGSGTFESAFGKPAPNDLSGAGDKSIRVRLDLFFSPVPYQRMVNALAQTTSLSTGTTPSERQDDSTGESNGLDSIAMDKIIRDIIVSTHAYSDPSSPLHDDPSICNIEELSRLIAKPPMDSSTRLAQQVIKFIQANPQRFRELNRPQLSAVQAALTRHIDTGTSWYREDNDSIRHCLWVRPSVSKYFHPYKSYGMRLFQCWSRQPCRSTVAGGPECGPRWKAVCRDRVVVEPHNRCRDCQRP